MQLLPYVIIGCRYTHAPLKASECASIQLESGRPKQICVSPALDANPSRLRQHFCSSAPRAQADTFTHSSLAGGDAIERRPSTAASTPLASETPQKVAAALVLASAGRCSRRLATRRARGAHIDPPGQLNVAVVGPCRSELSGRAHTRKGIAFGIETALALCHAISLS